MPPRSRRASADAAARAADQALLIRRLRELGLTGVSGVAVHENRSVLVSVTPRGVLRLHRGYAYASDRTLEHVIAFANPAGTRGRRRAAQDVISAFPVHDYVPSQGGGGRQRRRTPPPVDERRVVRKLEALYDRLNQRHFEGRLPRVPFRLSRRMETRLGELTVEVGSLTPVEIAISRRHIEQDGWAEVERTLLHEMVHQWQVESGAEPDHGPAFRRKAKEVGIAPSADRMVHRTSPAGDQREEQGWLFTVSTSTTSNRC
ncbi:MAG: SprT-like domain-containing protein [Gemmatimonadales bacterium]|jgi:hypothetical protein